MFFEGETEEVLLERLKLMDEVMDGLGYTRVKENMVVAGMAMMECDTRCFYDYCAEAIDYELRPEEKTLLKGLLIQRKDAINNYLDVQCSEIILLNIEGNKVEYVFGGQLEEAKEDLDYIEVCTLDRSKLINAENQLREYTAYYIKKKHIFKRENLDEIYGIIKKQSDPNYTT